MKRLLIIFLLTMFSTVGAQDDKTTWCVSVWYPSSESPDGFDSITNNLDTISTVNPFWYSPMADGSLLAQPGSEDADELEVWREAELVIMPSIFSSISTMIETPELRATHIEEIVDLVERMEYDGIDIDYEGFEQRTRDDFSIFIEELSEALHTRGRLLSIAVHAKTDDEGSWEGAAAQDWTRLAPAVDIFSIMTYDYASRNSPPGPIGPPEWALEVLRYAESVTDLSKVQLGVHFYGYSWLRGNPPATTISWEGVQRWVSSFDLTIQRDEADQEARVDLDVRGLPDQTIYVADAAGIEYKLNLVREAYPELRGIAIWGLGGEDPGNWEVIRSMVDCS